MLALACGPGNESSDPGCGRVLGVWDGTIAYSNGKDTGTASSCAGVGRYGEQYQCVELVMRYFDTRFGLSWPGNAAQLLENAPTRDVDVYYNGSATMPVPGDFIVWTDFEFGHTALVTAVTTSAITILQQNISDAGAWATLPISGGRIHGPQGWGWIDPAGWGHAKVNGNVNAT
jgi:hypothetical protein